MCNIQSQTYKQLKLTKLLVNLILLLTGIWPRLPKGRGQAADFAHPPLLDTGMGKFWNDNINETWKKAKDAKDKSILVKIYELTKDLNKPD